MVDIAQTVQEQAGAIALVSAGLSADNRTSVEENMVKVFQAFLKGIPGAGPLLAEGMGAAFAHSSYMQMKGELALREGEEAREAFLGDIEARVAELLAQTLYQVLNKQQRLSDEHKAILAKIEARMGQLHEHYAQFRAQIQGHMEGFHVLIGHMDVVEGAVGIRLRGDSGKRAKIDTMKVSDKGSIGLEL